MSLQYLISDLIVASAILGIALGAVLIAATYWL